MRLLVMDPLEVPLGLAVVVIRERQVEGAAGMAAVEDYSELHPRRKGFNQGVMHILVKYIPRRVSVDRTDGVLLACHLAQSKVILRLAAMATVVEEEGVARRGILD